MKCCKYALALATAIAMIAMLFAHTWEGMVLTALAAILCVEVLTLIRTEEIAETMEKRETK